MTGKRIFISKLLLIAIILLLADTGIGSLLEHFYFKIKQGEQGRLSYIIDSARQDILILGSSRASHHYDTKIIEDSLGLSCYNAGKDKQGLYYDLALLEMILQHHRPKLIVLDLNPDAFAASENGLDALSVLLPYYKTHPEIRSIVNKRSKWEPVKTYSSLYRYNSMLLQILFNNPSAEQDTGVINGYLPILHSFSASIDSASLLKQIADRPDSNLVYAYVDIIRTAAAHNCKLVVVSSPIFLTISRPSRTIELARAGGQVSFLDYTREKKFTGQKFLFGNAYHLNDTGARLFTQLLCADINRLGILKNP